MSETIVTEAFVQYGTVSFRPGQEAVADTHEFRDGVNYHTVGHPETPSTFEVDFKIKVEAQNDGLDCHSYISLTIPVAIADRKTTFAEIEGRAADAILPILRGITDAIEKQMAEPKPEQATEVTP